VRYCVIGGMAMAHYGSARPTKDIDLLVDPAEDNVRLLQEALMYLPDGAAREVRPTDLAEYTVVRVADEIVVDLLSAACGLTLSDLATRLEPALYDGVPIPFASPEALLQTKQTIRPHDAADCLFLADLLAARRRRR
jgi:hypothetical protein